MVVQLLFINKRIVDTGQSYQPCLTSGRELDGALIAPKPQAQAEPPASE
jgi:hypothetical protein